MTDDGFGHLIDIQVDSFYYSPYGMGSSVTDGQAGKTAFGWPLRFLDTGPVRASPCRPIFLRKTTAKPASDVHYSGGKDTKPKGFPS